MSVGEHKLYQSKSIRLRRQLLHFIGKGVFVIKCEVNKLTRHHGDFPSGEKTWSNNCVQTGLAAILVNTLSP